MGPYLSGATVLSAIAPLPLLRETILLDEKEGLAEETFDVCNTLNKWINPTHVQFTIEQSR